MGSTDVSARLTKVFIRVLGDNSIVLTQETTAGDLEGWDSFNHFNIILAVEEEFGVKFSMIELTQLKNVGSFVNLIGNKLTVKSE